MSLSFLYDRMPRADLVRSQHQRREAGLLYDIGDYEGLPLSIQAWRNKNSTISRVGKRR